MRGGTTSSAGTLPEPGDTEGSSRNRMELKDPHVLLERIVDCQIVVEMYGYTAKRGKSDKK